MIVTSKALCMVHSKCSINGSQLLEGNTDTPVAYTRGSVSSTAWLLFAPEDTPSPALIRALVRMSLKEPQGLLMALSKAWEQRWAQPRLRLSEIQPDCFW